jgi:hypothetical protein
MQLVSSIVSAQPAPSLTATLRERHVYSIHNSSQIGLLLLQHGNAFMSLNLNIYILVAIVSTTA